MPLVAPTLLTSGTSQTGTTGQATDTVTPTANSLLLVFQMTGTEPGITTPPTFSAPTTALAGVGAWSSAQGTAVAGRAWRAALWWAQCGASPGSGTITLRTTAQMRRWAWIVAEITGHDTAAPIRQTKTGTGTSSSMTVTLDATPFSDSAVYAGVASANQLGGINPGSGYVEIAESGTIESSGHNVQTQYDLTPTTTCNWTGLGTQGNVGIAVEIAAGIAAPPPPPPPPPPVPTGPALLLEDGFYRILEDGFFRLLEDAAPPPPPPPPVPPPPPPAVGAQDTVAPCALYLGEAPDISGTDTTPAPPPPPPPPGVVQDTVILSTLLLGGGVGLDSSAPPPPPPPVPPPPPPPPGTVKRRTITWTGF